MPVALCRPVYSAEPLLKPETLEKMRESLVAYRFMCLVDLEDVTGGREYKAAPFHHRLSDLLLHNREHVVIEMFRESGKSAYAIMAFPLYCFSYPRKDRSYIVLLKASDRLARAKLKEIRNEYKTNPLVAHNLVRITDDSANVFGADVRDEEDNIINVRIEAYGKGASIRGMNNNDRRPQIVLCDDVQTRADALSNSVSASDWEWFLSEVVFLGKNSRIFYIGNNLGERCIAERIFNNAGTLEKIKFTPIKVQVMVDGKPSWPARDTVEDILQERDDFTKLGKASIWHAEKMCEAVADESRVFREEDYRVYDSAQREAALQKPHRIAACLDTASSVKDTACYRAISVVGADDDNRWLLLDMKYGRWDTIGMIDHIFSVVEEYKLMSFGIEKGQIYQILEPVLLEEMRRRNKFFALVELEHSAVGSKLERIKMLQPRFRAHAILFPDHSTEWLEEVKAELAGVTVDALKSEYVDCIDSLAMHIQVQPLGSKPAEDIAQIRAQYREAVHGGAARAHLAKLEDKLHINYAALVDEALEADDE
jgi:predicted phage terminase large subunit-like protein